MKKQIFAAFLLLMLTGFSSSFAAAQTTHNIWTNQHGMVVRDADGCLYTSLPTFNMATSWTEPAPPTYPSQAHFRGVAKGNGFSPTCVTRTYDFTLIQTTSTTANQITGRWRVYRDGLLVCNNCTGTASDLNQSAGVGKYYKVYVDDPGFGPQAWLYSGYIDIRKDF